MFQKPGLEHFVLNAPAMAVLFNLEQIGKYVIASRTEDEKPYVDLNGLGAMVTRHAGLVT